MNIHPVTKNTLSAFTALWETAFGDSPEVIQDVLSCLGNDQTSFVLEDEGRICSALTQFYMGDLVFPSYPSSGKPAFPPVPVLVSYAISTDPEAREKGYGSAITAFAQKEAGRQGAVSMLSPADPGLVGFYEPLGYRPLFPAVTEMIALSGKKSLSDPKSVPDFSPDQNSAEVISPVRLTPATYFTVREQYLAEVPHIRLSDAAQRFAEWCCSGGGFFLFEKEGILLAMERWADGTIVIPELLISPDKKVNLKTDDPFSSRSENMEVWLSGLCSQHQKETSFSSPAASGSRTAAVQAMISFEGLSGQIRSAAEEILLKANDPDTPGYAPYFGFTFG